MLADGLYKVAFQTPIGAGAGVVHLVGGRMWGGDAALYYVGTYNLAGEQVSASVTTNRHTAGYDSVFGVDRVHITLRGQTRTNEVHLEGSAVEAPGISFKAFLTKISD